MAANRTTRYAGPVSELTVLAALGADILRRARAHLPGVVVAYDPTTGRARVTVGLQGTTAQGVPDKPLEVPDAPVLWPRFGGCCVMGSLVPGDTVLLAIADRAIDRWLLAGGVVPLESDRMHEITDAVVLPGLMPDSRPPPAGAAAALTIGREDGTATLAITSTGPGVIQATATTIQLGSAGAAEAVIQGTSLAADLAVIDGILGLVPPAVDPASAAMANACAVAIQAMIAAIQARLSTTVLVD